MRAGTRVLVVEDDRSIAGFVEPELERLGFRVRCAYDGLSGLREVREFRPEIVVLDIMLPGLDGVRVLKEIRSGGSKVPVIMLTARDATLDKVHSLDLGADDYVTKPFEMEELLAQEYGVTTNVVEVYIAYLRKKVDAPGKPPLIRTIRGAGYALRGA
jgi:DNA-binding response OmpR family regulator